MDKEKKLKKILNICILIYVITLVYAFVYNIKLQDMNHLSMTFVACFTPLIVPVLFKVFHFKPVYEIYLVSTIFCYFASLIGSGLRGYSIPYFDKALHFSSGFFITVVAMIVYMLIKKTKEITEKDDYLIYLLFINFMNITVAAFWEFYEYALLIFFNNDCVNHYTTGVHDSLTDMIVCTLGGLIVTYMVMSHHKNGKENFFVNVAEKFYSRNIEKH